jgi:hypothetical protein
MSLFKPISLFYFPSSLIGVLVTFLAAAFCIQIFLFVDARSHSASDTLYGVFPYWAPTFLLWIWSAERTSRQGGE